MTDMSDIESEQAKKKIIDDVIKAAKIGERLSKHHLHPDFRSWAYLNHGKPTLDTGILFLTDDGHCVGMYHLTDCSLMISRIGFGPGGVAGLTQFAHQMDTCDSADDFFERLPELLKAYEACKTAEAGYIGK